jgi:hypothetical protein
VDREVLARLLKARAVEGMNVVVVGIPWPKSCLSSKSKIEERKRLESRMAVEQ